MYQMYANLFVFAFETHSKQVGVKIAARITVKKAMRVHLHPLLVDGTIKRIISMR